MRGNPHNNPWADRLLQVSMPDSGEAWQAMEAVLKREMPRHAWKDWKRWLLLILLLLLLIGVCHCPGVGRPGRTTGATKLDRIGRPGPLRREATPTPRHAESRPGKPTAEMRRTRSDRSKPATKKTGSLLADEEDEITSTNSGHVHVTERTKDRSNRIMTKGKDNVQTTDGTTNGTTGVPRRPKRIGGPDSPDSSRGKTPPPAKKKEKETKEKGWMAGIGLNQFFPLGGQQSPYNSSGITGTITDYLPVPMLRYYFNRQLYVQLEAQFNTPQAAKKNVVISSPPQDSLPNTRQYQIHSTSIKELFYFNLPLSIHYVPLENLNIGAGLQFSRLTDAIGSFDTSTWNMFGTPDTVNTKSSRTLKGDTLYRKIRTNEFRLLLDASYTYKHFILGVRYNHALSPFVRVQIVPGQVTQSRNSSLQLYLRYILWDARKKKSASPPE